MTWKSIQSSIQFNSHFFGSTIQNQFNVQRWTIHWIAQFIELTHTLHSIFWKYNSLNCSMNWIRYKINSHWIRKQECRCHIFLEVQQSIQFKIQFKVQFKVQFNFKFACWHEVDEHEILKRLTKTHNSIQFNSTKTSDDTNTSTHNDNFTSNLSFDVHLHLVVVVLEMIW